MLTQKMTEQSQEFIVSEKEWKLNFKITQQINQPPGEDEEDEEEKSEFVPIVETSEIQFEILKVPERDGLFFACFKRKGGAAMLYYGAAKQYCDQLALFNNATLEDGETQ